MTSIPFTKESIPEFFTQVSNMLIAQAKNPPESAFPTDRFFHAFGGSVEGKPFKFFVAMLLTTNSEIFEAFQRDFVIYAKQKVAEKK